MTIVVPLLAQRDCSIPKVSNQEGTVDSRYIDYALTLAAHRGCRTCCKPWLEP